MKARVRESGNWWIGEVYGTWQRFIMGIPMGEWTGWKQVTDRCFTKGGAKTSLRLWKQRHLPEEYEI